MTKMSSSYDVGRSAFCLSTLLLPLWSTFQASEWQLPEVPNLCQYSSCTFSEKKGFPSLDFNTKYVKLSLIGSVLLHVSYTDHSVIYDPATKEEYGLRVG